ncbi:MAG: DUF1552 domain-containing protein [Myxococcota bacterium]
MKKKLNRRRFLAGAGVAVSLPFLDAMLPAGQSAIAQEDAPTRLMYVYVPYGIIRTNFTPQQAGRDYTMPSMLTSLSDLRSKLTVLSGISHRPGQGRYTYPDGTESNDGPGDHARDTGTFLTAARLHKTEGSDIRNGISIDQVAARHLAPHTAIPSLALATRGGSYGGDSGYAPIYRANISWADETTPVPKDANPRSVFETLFGGFDPTENATLRAERIAREQSILDACLDDLASLERELGTADRVKLDGYLTGIRQLEMRIDEGVASITCDPGEAPPDNGDFDDVTDRMFELSKLAFQCDRTRVISVLMESRGYGFLGGISDGHHQMSHLEQGDPDITRIQRINTWQVEQFASLMQRFDDVVEDEGTLLDNSLIMFGGGLDATGHSGGNTLGDLTPQRSGPVHRHTNLPLLMGGSGRGRFRSGEHVVYDDEPLANLYLKMLEVVGAPDRTFGIEGTEPISGV